MEPNVEINDTPKLTPREQLMQRVLEISDREIWAVLSFIDQIEDISDRATIEARKDEVGIPLDDVLKDLGLTRQQLMEVAKSEGLIQ